MLCWICFRWWLMLLCQVIWTFFFFFVSFGPIIHAIFRISQSDIALEPDKAVKKVEENLKLGLTDEEAVQHLQNLLDLSITAVMPALVEQIHKLAQYWRKWRVFIFLRKEKTKYLCYNMKIKYNLLFHAFSKAFKSTTLKNSIESNWCRYLNVPPSTSSSATNLNRK